MSFSDVFVFVFVTVMNYNDPTDTKMYQDYLTSIKLESDVRGAGGITRATLPRSLKSLASVPVPNNQSMFVAQTAIPFQKPTPPVNMMLMPHMIYQRPVATPQNTRPAFV